LGTAILTSPAYSSPQYSIDEIFTAAGISTIKCVAATCPPGAYQGSSLYVTNSNKALAGFQHVIYNSNSQFFENLSICGDASLSDGKNFVSTSNVINVHTTRIPGYPSFVMFHNYWTVAIYYDFQVFDAVTEQRIGSYRAAAAANTSYLIPMSAIQDSMGWTRMSGESHVNILSATMRVVMRLVLTAEFISAN